MSSAREEADWLRSMLIDISLWETTAGRSGKRPIVDIQSQSDHDTQGFEDFSTLPPTEILKKEHLLSDDSASQHTKRRRTVRFDSAAVEEQVYQKTSFSVSTRTVPTQKIPSSDSERVHAEKTTPSSSSNYVYVLYYHYKDVEGCCEDIATTRPDALVKFVDVEGVSADIGPATLESLIAVVENLKPDSANVDYSSTLSELAQVELDAILEGIAAPVDDLPIEVVPPSEVIVNKHDISDSQLPPDFPDAVVATHQTKKSKLRNDQDYRFTTTNYFFKSYIVKTYSNYYEDDTDTIITTQQDYTQSVDVVLNEDAITNIIKGYCMPSGLPWHQVDEVYVPINCNDKFYWVLAVIALKDGRIRVYDSLSNLRNMESINEINKDCGVFVAKYAEYLSKGINVPSDGFEAEYHQKRYATLLQNYGIQKAQKGYVSENDDPPRPRSRSRNI
ncbi:hypothetical protein BC332_03380 [Capsicum chinense]|nr:hypothetical protein BC332_03380 [Capsicum chinense]